MQDNSSREEHNDEEDGVVMDEQEVALFQDFHSPKPVRKIWERHLPTSTSPRSIAICDCLSMAKKGRYSEYSCLAHDLTLRNSLPSPRALGPMALSPERLEPSILYRSAQLDLQLGLSSSLDQLESFSDLQAKSMSNSESSSSLPQLSPRAAFNVHAMARSPLRSAKKTFVNEKQDVSVLAMEKTHRLAHSKIEEMIAGYSKLISINADIPRDMAIIHARRSILYAAISDFEKAIEDAEECIRLGTATAVEPLGYYRKGYASFALGRIADAAEAFQKGLEHDTRSPHLRRALDITLKCLRHSQ